MAGIHDYLGVPRSWPIKENMRHAIVVMPNKLDVKKAKKRDPRACALHNAACRIYNIPNCAIGGRWAYIPQRDQRGKFYIARVQATHATQRAIREFDKTGKMPDNGFIFIPLAKSHTIAWKKAYNSKYRRNGGGKTRHLNRKRPTRRMMSTRHLPTNLTLRRNGTH